MIEIKLIEIFEKTSRFKSILLFERC